MPFPFEINPGDVKGHRPQRGCPENHWNPATTVGGFYPPAATQYAVALPDGNTVFLADKDSAVKLAQYVACVVTIK